MRAFLFALTFLGAAIASAQTIRPEALRGIMRFLSSDLLEGRGTGARGYQIAAEYVASQLESLGIAPGANGTYFQSVPFLRTTVDGQQSWVRIGDKTLRYDVDFIAYGEPLRDVADVDAAVVFVGYGVTAPERGYDDYKGIDTKGRIVAFLTGGPSSFPSEERAHYGATTTKLNNAADHGAVGTISLRTPYAERMYAWARSVRQSHLGGMNWLEADATPHATRREVLGQVTMSRSGAEALFGSAAAFDETVAAVEKGERRSGELPVRAAIHVVSTHARLESPNVVGVLGGSDPALRNEYVVYSGHLDHLGITDPVDGDSINNGALDNASGIAAMLEIARAFVEAPRRPRRSILFLATTGEEKGLRGADYFANNPTVPLQSIVANVNVDEILMQTRTRDVVLIGAEHSTLSDVAASVARRANVSISPDPYPDEAVFVRSDQYPFVKRGVPAVFVLAGYRAVDPNVDAQKLQMQWITTLYHTPKDDMTQPIDFGEGAMVTDFAWRLGHAVANATARPQWKKGDFFGTTFGR